MTKADAADSRHVLRSHPCHQWGRIAAFCVVLAFLTSYANAQGTPAEPQTQTADPSAAAAGQSTAESAQPGSTDKSKAKKDKSEKKDKSKAKKTETESGGDSAKPPKHPSWKPLPGVKLDFKARIETEARPIAPPATLDDSALTWQDRRLGVEGTMFKRLSFEVSRELSQDFEAVHDLSEKSAWKDAYVSARVSKALSIDAGRFKLPFGREELIGEPNLDFAYRSLAARVLSPGRDVGVMTHGRLFNRRAEYQIGYFTRDGENGRTSQTQGGQDALAGRLVVKPFAGLAERLIAPLEIGVDLARSHNDNRLGLRGRTVLADGIFFDRLYVNGLRRRVGLDAGWENGPVALSGEFVTVSDERKGMGFGGADLSDVRARAWYAAATWALTGERKHGRLEPSHDLLRGGLGAFELALRSEGLTFQTANSAGSLYGFPASSALAGNADHATTVGVNWYVNHYVKLQSDMIVEWIEDPERSPSPATGGRFVSTVFRLQFHF